MPRYFFHVRSPERLMADPSGTDLPDIEAVKQEAITRGVQMMGEASMAGEDRKDWRFEIRDEADREVHTLPFAKAIPAG